MRIQVLQTPYWRPGIDWKDILLESVRDAVDDGDIVVISEKPISVALGNILDESSIQPSSFSKFLASFWMRAVWGLFLGRLCHLSDKAISRLRRYPADEGAKHKEASWRIGGIRQALKAFSEGGIDGSNLPGSLVALPLRHPIEIAKEARGLIRERLGKEVSVMLVDSDKTYSFRSLHLAPRKTDVEGLKAQFALLSYIFGRALRLRKRATPIAIAGLSLHAELALDLANAADRAMGSGAGRTVWDMAERFKVGLAEVAWEMLEQVEHRPIAVIRR